jgi:signal transduction histidine kinase
MRRILTLWFFFLFISFGYSQSNVKRIDSLIDIAKTLQSGDSSKKILALIKKESELIDYKDGLANYSLINAMNLFNASKYADALALTYEAEPMVLKTKKNDRISHLYALRANCFTQLFFYEKSYEYLTLANDFAEKILDNNAKIRSLGRIYRVKAANFTSDPKTKNIDSALFYHKLSYARQQKVSEKNFSSAGFILQAGIVGRLFFEKKNFDSSKYYFKKAISEAEKFDLQKHSFSSLLGMGNIFYKEHKIDSAINYYLKALDIAKNNNNGLDLKHINKKLANVFESINETKKANFYYKKYAFLTDSVYKANIASSSIVAKYVIKEQEATREKQDQLREVYLIFTSALALLSVFIVIILYKNTTASRKNNKTLSMINKSMVEQNIYLKNTLEALEQSTENNNKVMQIIAHDLRSPMAAIVGLSDFMLQEHALSAEDREVIELIHSSGNDSLSFINEILQSQQDSLKKEVLDLDQLINYCVIQAQFRAKEKKQIIIVNSQSIIIAINREKIWRVISNLINNAIKFSPVGVDIEVSLVTNVSKAIFSVKDNGIGIPENLKDKIFVKNNEGKRLGTDGEASFGIGLSICKEIIEAHDGVIWFESEVNRGTTFFFTLPIAN